MSELTTEQILNEWIYVGNTEANGKHYHDEKSDRAAIVYSGSTKVFSNRRDGIKGNYPYCYDDVDYIES